MDFKIEFLRARRNGQAVGDEAADALQRGEDRVEKPPALCRVGWSLNQGLKGGGHMESLGFSVRAELAHQNQGQPPFSEVLGQRITFNHEHGRGNRS